MTLRVGFPNGLKVLDEQHEALLARVRELTESVIESNGDSLRVQVQDLVRMLREHAEQEE
jgi:hypothetical protein